MKQLIRPLGYVLCLLASFFVACNNESDGMPTGALYLNVEEDASVLTKAGTDVTNELLRVDIISADEDTIKSYSNYLEEVKGQKIVIPVGTYTVAVSSNQTEEAGWEKPFYAGSEEITVKAGEITAAQVICKITNTKVTVEYADSLALYFSNYETTVSNSSGSLLYTRDEYRAGYFKAEKLTAKLKLINKDGNEFSLQRVFPDIQEQYFYKIKFSLDNNNDNEGDQAGGDFGGITIEEKADTIYYGIYIKEEDLFGKNTPTLKLTGFENNKITYTKTDDPKIPEHSVTVKAVNGIKQLRMEVSSFQFPDMPSFDFCNLTDAERIRLEALNFPVPDVKDKTEITLSLKDFAKSLETSSETLAETHSFKIYALDNLHQETDITFAYEVRPDIAAYVESPRCWSTFAVLKGYCMDANAEAYFKFQTGEGEIIDIKTVGRDTDGNVSALVTGLASKTVYKYWLVSDTNVEMKCEPVLFELTTPIDVPNIGFDSWGTREGKAPIVGMKTYVSPNADSGDVYWDSGNLGAAAAKKTLTDATATKALSESTNAAILKSQYAGIPGVAGAFAAGSVYSGFPKSITSDGAILAYGRPFQGFPTHLRGFYKYTPGTIDYYDSRSPGALKNGDTDQCLILIALSTKQHDVVSTTSSVVPYPFDDESVFAYGEYVSGTTEDKTGETPAGTILNGYAPFKVKLKYKTDVPKSGPFYILIVASASRYGDYFTGSTSSVMYVDEFSLDYNFDAEAFSGTGLKGMTPVKINE